MSAGEQLWVVLAEAGLVSGVASSLHILSLGLASLAQLLRIELMILHKARSDPLTLSLGEGGRVSLVTLTPV